MANNIEKEGMLPIGTVLCNGKYRVEKYISSGGFGNTYLATDLAFDEKVAIKELFIKGVCGRLGDSTDISISLTENQRTFDAQQEKFKKEAKRIRKLSNNHIVKVHNLFDENGTSYYVMDYVEGESLSERLKRTGKPMSEADVMLIIPQLLDALSVIHENQIWHLDIKPANIMMDKMGNALLIDFGASKQLRNADGSSLSTSSALAYTPGYAPSEQMDQKIENFGPWTDLYALGATLYNLLTRKQPPTPSDIMENADEALRLPDSVSKKTHDLIVWLMKPVRTMRPQNVSAIKQYLSETPAKPQPEKPKPQQPKPSEPKPLPEEDRDDTVLKSGRTNKPKTDNSDTIAEKKPKTEKKKKSATKSNKKILFAGIAVAGAVVLFGGIGILAGGGGISNDKVVVDEDVPVDSAITAVDPIDITLTSGPKNLRKFSYTGSLDLSGKYPEGEGEAHYPAYEGTSASTYNGNFKSGLPHDDGVATMVFENGDEYKGSFSKGYYVKGTYKLSDGSYFEGTFESGKPYNGSWYTKDGQADGQVVNGN